MGHWRSDADEGSVSDSFAVFPLSGGERLTLE